MQTTFETILLYMGIASTLFFLLLAAASIMGLDGIETDVDVDDLDTDTSTGFQPFTFRNLLAMLVGISWGGLALLDSGYSEVDSILYGFLIGMLFATLQSTLFYLMYKLQEKNEPSLQSAVDSNAIVYQPIPKIGTGKIQVVVNGSTKTLEALSEGDQSFKTGTNVTITKVMSNDTCLVTKS